MGVGGGRGWNVNELLGFRDCLVLLHKTKRNVNESLSGRPTLSRWVNNVS